jgi:hypothetical protein
VKRAECAGSDQAQALVVCAVIRHLQRREDGKRNLRRDGARLSRNSTFWINRLRSLNHLHLHVRSVEHARAFYANYFGLHDHVMHGDILFMHDSKNGLDLALAPTEALDAFPDCRGVLRVAPRTNRQ